MAITIEPNSDALGVLHVQPTFMPGGAIPTPDGGDVISPINRLLRLPFRLRFATQDWHPSGHVSFASSHPGSKPMQTLQLGYGPLTLWPDHALQNTDEAALHQKLEQARIDFIVRKGVQQDADGLSAFSDNGGKIRSGLASLLRECGVRRVFLAGLVLDVGVAASAEDAAREGFATYVIEDACRASTSEAATQTRERLKSSGVVFVEEKTLS